MDQTMTLEWSEELAVGHPLIDRQHQSLFDQFAAFLTACNQHQPEHLQKLFGFLDEYVQLHFREEEALMEAHGYLHIARHKEEHRVFTEMLRDLKSELATTGPTAKVLVQTNKVLIYWLTEHIKNLDTGLAAFLKNGG